MEILSRKIDYQCDFGLANGEGADELIQFGQELNDGRIHLGCIWGLEYGWLHQEYPQLEMMVTASQGVGSQMKSSWPARLMCREDFQGGFGALKGKTLASYKRLPLMNQLFLKSRLEQHGYRTNESFFRAVKPCRTLKQAIIAVRDKEADCVVVDAGTYVRHITSHPSIRLETLEISEPFPDPVIVGRPDLVEQLRVGLWQTTRDELETIHRTAEGKQCCMFWQMDAFVNPTPHFHEVIRQRVLEYPLSALRGPALYDRP